MPVSKSPVWAPACWKILGTSSNARTNAAVIQSEGSTVRRIEVAAGLGWLASTRWDDSGNGVGRYHPTAMEVASTASAIFGWQGFTLALPRDWNPVKLDGTFDTGHALIADLHGPKLGLRWRRVGARRLDASAWARRAIEAEVGKAAAGRARALSLAGAAWAGSTLWLDPDPPGRDVWAAHSAASNRVVEIVYHVPKRDRVLEDRILAALTDAPAAAARIWSVFDLRCIVPGAYELKAHRLNAGDVGLTFAAGRESLAIRQIALARLALQRLPLEKWLSGQESAVQRYYRAAGDAGEIELAGAAGVMRHSRRRRRYSFMRWLPRSVVTIALHDARRDRLVLVQGSSEAAVRALAISALG